MADFNTIKVSALRTISPRAPDQNNYGDPELLVYGNEFLDEMSKELASFRARVARVSTTVGIPAGGTTCALPTDFQMMHRVFQNGTDYLLRQASEAEIDDWEDSSNSGDPWFYWIIGNTLHVDPSPSARFALKLVYYPLKSLSAVTDTVPWGGIFDNALKYYLVKRARQRSRMFGYAAIDELAYKNARQRGMAMIIQQDCTRIGFSQGYSKKISRRGPFYYNDPNYP